MRIDISGHSDDIVAVRVVGPGGETGEEFQGYIFGTGRYSRSLSVATIGGTQAVRVHAIYDGCWSFAVGQIDEGRRLPDWKFTIGHEHTYSVRLTIDTGDELVAVEADPVR